MQDLLVHLDGRDRDGDDNRLAHAEALAAALPAARITGLYINPLPEYAYVLGVNSGLADMTPVIELEAQLRREGDRIAASLRDRLSRPGAPFELRRIDDQPSAIPHLAASQTRCMDLLLAGTPYRGAGWDALVETVLFEGGRAVLLVPPHCPVRSALRTVLVAWKDARESARALAEAMPLLRLATRIVLLSVDTDAARDGGEREADIAAHLARHGLAVEVVTANGTEADVGDIVLAHAEKVGADLIAVGAYGHSRLREWMLGGVTRTIIERTTVPLLMAH